jgi:hypothetical protein
MAEPFIFGIPMIARAAARNWPFVQALLDLTLASVQAQTDPDFRIVIAGHDEPSLPCDDTRITFIEADWPPQPVRADNLDSGRKKFAINQLVLASGGGLLMFVDADDWIDARLVETARAKIGPKHVGGIVDAGFATDLRSLRAAPIPHPRIYDGEFHRVCGSSTILRLKTDDPDPLIRNPYAVLHEHYRWIEVAAEHCFDFVRLPVFGNYVINTSQNHSETHGPYARWRRCFADRVRREGRETDSEFLAQFGLFLDQVRAISSWF